MELTPRVDGEGSLVSLVGGDTIAVLAKDVGGCVTDTVVVRRRFVIVFLTEFMLIVDGVYGDCHLREMRTKNLHGYVAGCTVILRGQTHSHVLLDAGNGHLCGAAVASRA